LKEGKIYDHSKVQQALTNFFQPEKILQLRELALKEVAGQVERKVDYSIDYQKNPYRHERFLACISSNSDIAQRIIRKTARLASYYNSQWYVLYVQTSKESAERIALDKQRHLINNFKNATELGAEVIQLKEENIAQAILEMIRQKQVTTLCIGKPHIALWQVILKTSMFNQLLKAVSETDVDIVILS
jgi:two-component system sensor histidine kinase KdpD